MPDVPEQKTVKQGFNPVKVNSEIYNLKQGFQDMSGQLSKIFDILKKNEAKQASTQAQKESRPYVTEEEEQVENTNIDKPEMTEEDILTLANQITLRRQQENNSLPEDFSPLPSQQAIPARSAPVAQPQAQQVQFYELFLDRLLLSEGKIDVLKIDVLRRLIKDYLTNEIKGGVLGNEAQFNADIARIIQEFMNLGLVKASKNTGYVFNLKHRVGKRFVEFLRATEK